MRLRLFALGMVTLLGMENAAPANADVLEANATAVVLPDDGSGVAKVALRFELTGMRQGSGLTVQSAAIWWELPAMPANRMSTFQGYRFMSPWGVLGPDAVDVINALGEEPEMTWEVFPQDHDRIGKRLMKLNVTGLVQEVLDQGGSSVSVIVTTTDVPRRAMSEEVANVRLAVRYGFLGHLAPLFER